MRRLLIAGVLLCSMSSVVWASWRLMGNEFPKEVKSSQDTLNLQGVGVKTIFMMRVFIAGLYLPQAMSDRQALGDVPKHLAVRFYARFSSNQFVDYTISRMKANLSKAEFQAVKDRFDLMRKYFPNIKKGDEMALSYEPGQGTSISLNGQVTGVIPGLDFSKAVFATWIGPRPFDHIVKAQILGID